jgi:hypothetical protein
MKNSLRDNLAARHEIMNRWWEMMTTGICALCGEEAKLHESHFLPKGLYRLLRESNTKNDNPVLISARLSIQKSFQMTQRLLCSRCERRFSDGGENYVLPLLKHRNHFPLLDRLKLALPLYTTHEKAAFLCPSVGLDGEKIGYFGLSILWRAARPWRMFDGATTSIQIEDRYLESIRRYLVGETTFPNDVAAIVTVATDYLSQSICMVPNRITDNTMHIAYGLLTKGLYFRFILGENQPPAMRAISCAGEGPNMIFAKDCGEKSWPAAGAMMETTVSKGQFADLPLTTK